MNSLKYVRLVGFRSVSSGSFKNRRRRTWLSYSLLAFPAIAFSLGFWQIRRRKWKINLLQALKDRIPAEPTPLPLKMASSRDLPEFTAVKLRGHFDHSREMVIGPRSLMTDFIQPNGYGSEWLKVPSTVSSGYCIVTPFFLADRPGVSVLVNRGWVPTGARDPAFRSKGQIEGTIELAGYVRYPEKPPPFAGEPRQIQCTQVNNQKPQYQFYCRQIEKMAECLHTLPIFIDANYDSSIIGGPIGGQTRVALRNEHASYIFTWFSLGTIGLGMWIYFFVW